MARNATRTLTPAQSATGNGWALALSDRAGTHLDVDYTKRDGTRSVISGTMLHIAGDTEDKRVVVLDTDKGPRSANLWAIHGVTMD